MISPATILLLLFTVQTVTASSRSNPQYTTAQSMQRPDWLTVPNDTLLLYLQQARQRHHDAVKAATHSYWSANTNTNAVETGEDTVEADVSDITLMKHTLQPPGSWQLPDFSSDLAGTTIFTTLNTPLFTVDECNDLIQKAESHFGNGPWTTLPSGQYNVAGFWIHGVPAVHQWFNDNLKQKLFPLLLRAFPTFLESIDTLCVDNAYLFKYTPETGRRTGVHTDSGCLSFTIALNSNNDYKGGGTWIEGLSTEGGKIEMNQGHVTVRPGGVRHCGYAVEDGTRYIIGGFCMHKQKIEYVRILIGLGSQLAEQNKLQEAKDALECAIYLNPRFDGAFTHLAQVLVKLDQPDKAQKVLQHCLEQINPNNGEVAYTLGLMYLKQEQYFEAKKCFDVCLQADDCDVDAMIALAQVCAGVGTPDGEASWYERIVKVPNASKENLASAYCNLGNLKEGTDREIECYDKALEVIPDNYQSRYSLGAAYASRQHWSLAAHQFRAAANLVDDKAKALTSLYRVALNIVQQESHSSQVAMVSRMQEVMGPENYQLLARSKGQ